MWISKKYKVMMAENIQELCEQIRHLNGRYDYLNERLNNAEKDIFKCELNIIDLKHQSKGIV